MSEEIIDIYVRLLRQNWTMNQVKDVWASQNRYIFHGLGKCLYPDWELVHGDKDG